MKILVINAGSSSLKYQLFDMEGEKVLAKGLCERIGIDGHLKHSPLVEGKKVFDGLCMACHGANSAIPYAPRVTKNDEWAPRIAKGKAVLLKHAMEGFTGPDGGVMPAKGGNNDLTEAQISAAINYMANQSGGNFK